MARPASTRRVSGVVWNHRGGDSFCALRPRVARSNSHRTQRAPQVGNAPIDPRESETTVTFVKIT